MLQRGGMLALATLDHLRDFSKVLAQDRVRDEEMISVNDADGTAQ